MREPPAGLPGDALAAGLRAGYGLDVAGLAFLPLGHDAAAWVYRVETAGGPPYFLKVRRRVTNAPSLLVPRFLHDQGITQVVAPLPTIAGALWGEVAGYALLLYPFVAGATGMDQGMTEPQWIAYGRILRQIHATAVPPALAALMRRETFVPPGVDTVGDVQARLAGHLPDDPLAQALTEFWHTQREAIQALMARVGELGQGLARQALPFVLCHADIHTANVLLDAAGQVWIVDWDEAVLAPRERDLMFAMGGGISRRLVGPREEELFRQGYGEAAINPLALTYYRYAWAVNDIGDYAMQVVARPDLGPVSREAALTTFESLFRPGEIVSLAFGSDEQTG
jgi:spectinomycin phosphotransferase